MNDKIVELNKLIQNKKELDNRLKTVNDLSLEELEGVRFLYAKEVIKLLQEVNKLEEENKKLKMFFGDRQG